jgi:hypothetical protein
MTGSPIRFYVSRSTHCPLRHITIIFAVLGVSMAHGWIDGTPFFFEGEGFKFNRSLDLSAPAQPCAPQMEVGNRQSFFSIDFRKHEQYIVHTTLQKVGKFCYIFVEDSQWKHTVNAATVEAVRHAFDDATPADRTRGIYQIETELFGNPPNIDGEKRIYILLLDIRDLVTVSGGFIGGFFSPVDQQQGVLQHPEFGTLVHSNERDMIYIDTHPLDAGGEKGLGVLAHEFQHLIHWRHDKDESIWVNEGCSDYAMFICGFSAEDHVTPFERNARVSLVNWPHGTRSQLSHYGAAYIWMLYLHEHYGGPETIAAVIKHRGNGITGINNALHSRGVTKTFSTIFADWKVANFLDDSQFAKGQYGYRNERLNLRLHRNHQSHPIAVTGNRLDVYEADYIGLSATGGEGALNIAFETDGKHPYDVRVIELQASLPITVRHMPLNRDGKAQLTIENFGTTVEQVILVPSVQPESYSSNGKTSSYAYSTRRGENVEFRFAVMPNPVHSRYWDIIAVPDDSIGVVAPLIAVTDGESVLKSVITHRTPMKSIRAGELYTHPLYLSLSVNPENVRWKVFFFEALVGEGNLELK